MTWPLHAFALSRDNALLYSVPKQEISWEEHLRNNLFLFSNEIVRQNHTGYYIFCCYTYKLLLHAERVLRNCKWVLTPTSKVKLTNSLDTTQQLQISNNQNDVQYSLQRSQNCFVGHKLKATYTTTLLLKYTHARLMALCLGLSGWAGTRRGSRRRIHTDNKVSFEPARVVRPN